MKWLPIHNRDGSVSPYAIRSEDGRFKIAKVTVKGEDIFELWDGRVRIGGWGTASEAKSRASAG